jgi:hypothetical protein
LQSKEQQDGNIRIRAANLRQELNDWVGTRRFKALSFNENEGPFNEPSADYCVVYEAQFIPDSTSQARLEITLTEGGFLGIGLETRQRVAERLKVRNSRDGFADGFEPTLTNLGDVLLLLDLISTGELVIHARAMPLLGLGRTKAATTSKRTGAAAIFARFYFAASLRTGLWVETLNFEPWH